MSKWTNTIGQFIRTPGYSSLDNLLPFYVFDLIHLITILDSDHFYINYKKKKKIKNLKLCAVDTTSVDGNVFNFGFSKIIRGK